MDASASPYALLRVCAQNKPPKIPSAYDLYSAMQPSHTVQQVPPEPPIQPFDTPQRSQPQKTHYVTDIHARHQAAGKRSRMQQASLM